MTARSRRHKLLGADGLLGHPVRARMNAPSVWLLAAGGPEDATSRWSPWLSGDGFHLELAREHGCFSAPNGNRMLEPEGLESSAGWASPWPGGRLPRGSSGRHGVRVAASGPKDDTRSWCGRWPGRTQRGQGAAYPFSLLLKKIRYFKNSRQNFFNVYF